MRAKSLSDNLRIPFLLAVSVTLAASSSADPLPQNKLPHNKGWSSTTSYNAFAETGEVVITESDACTSHVSAPGMAFAGVADLASYAKSLATIVQKYGEPAKNVIVGLFKHGTPLEPLSDCNCFLIPSYESKPGTNLSGTRISMTFNHKAWVPRNSSSVRVRLLLEGVSEHVQKNLRVALKAEKHNLKDRNRGNVLLKHGDEFELEYGTNRDVGYYFVHRNSGILPRSLPPETVFKLQLLGHPVTTRLSPDRRAFFIVAGDYKDRKRTRVSETFDHTQWVPRGSSPVTVRIGFHGMTPEIRDSFSVHLKADKSGKADKDRGPGVLHHGDVFTLEYGTNGEHGYYFVVRDSTVTPKDLPNGAYIRLDRVDQ